MKIVVVFAMFLFSSAFVSGQNVTEVKPEANQDQKSNEALKSVEKSKKHTVKSVKVLNFSRPSKVNKSSVANSQAGPSASVTYKTPLKPNLFILKINDLAGGDDSLTERVVLEIRNTKSTQIKNVVKDIDFDTLSFKQKKESIMESEVIAIINNLKK